VITAKQTGGKPRGKPRGKPFEKGKTANPAGRPKGSRSKATVMAERLLAERLDSVTRAILDKAAEGDVPAARLVLDRIMPVSSAKVEIALPPIRTAEDVTRAADMVLAAICKGELSIDDGARLMSVVEARLRLIEGVDWERGLKALERQQGTAKR
jgi:Family of unknown function (DUF5681)